MHAPMSLPHPTTLTSIHASLPHFLPSPALASPVGSPSSQPNLAVSNAQCSTLFVANLGQFVSEHELKDIFSSFPGFSRLRMHTKGGSPVAFVEYQDVRYAAQAMATLQGSFLLSSDRGAIRIEYAKSKMAEVGFTNLWIEGSKRQENGQP
ncbi:Cell wall integrity protein scw1 [Formica fusca]